MILTEYLRRQLPSPEAFSPEQKLYWFVDHVLFHGKFLVLAVMAFIPARPGLNARFLIAGGGLLVFAGTFLQIGHPLYLAAIAVPFGVALKLGEVGEKLAIVLTMAGLGLGMPLGGFTGMAVAGSQFHPKAIEQLVPATMAITSVAMAAAYTGLYTLVRTKLIRR